MRVTRRPGGGKKAPRESLPSAGCPLSPRPGTSAQFDSRAMNALEAMHARRSLREFTDELVPAETIRQLVTAAGRAPSSKNTQPWRLYLVQGAALDALRNDYLAAFDTKAPAKPGYAYSPNPLPEAWAARAKDCGIGIFKHKGIGRDELDKRTAHDRENFRFFGAKQMFFLGTQASAYSYGTFLDCGFVLDNLMLGLTALGYGSCPQFSVMIYPDLLRKHIPGTEDTLFIAGLPFGRPLPGSHVNEFQPSRLPLDAWFKTVE